MIKRSKAPEPTGTKNDDVAETVEIDTTTVSAADVKRLFPKASVAYVRDLQAIHLSLTDALAGARSRGVGASLSVARAAIDLAILFALRADELKLERHHLRDVIAAWVMIAGEGTDGAVGSANGLGSIGAMVTKLISRWKVPYAAAVTGGDAAKRRLVLDLVCQRMRWLLPHAPDRALVEEALGGPSPVKYSRSPLDVLVLLLESGSMSIDATADENKPEALKRDLAKHRKGVRSRLPPAPSQ